MFAAVKKDSKTIGMLAIENTIAGSLLHNNELLRQSGTQIIGEYKLRISHSFVCLPDEDWNDLTEVNSHPIALMQCREFLAQHPKMKVVEAEDTALSAEIITRRNWQSSMVCAQNIPISVLTPFKKSRKIISTATFWSLHKTVGINWNARVTGRVEGFYVRSIENQH